MVDHKYQVLSREDCSLFSPAYYDSHDFTVAPTNALRRIIFQRHLIPVSNPQVACTLRMAEPQPPTVHEGATGDIEDTEDHKIPKSAEDRKAAAALSSVSAHNDDTSQPAKDVDQEALGKAIKNLDISDDSKKQPVFEKKKAVKVDPEAVALLVRGLSNPLT